MMERFTDRARRVVVLAQEEARMLNHNYIGPEHILLGLIHEGDSVAAQVLVGLGADLNGVRQQVIQLLREYQDKVAPGAGSRPGERARAGRPDDVHARIGALDRRLAAVERWVGLGPDLEDLDQEIAKVRREKDAARDRKDFEAAAALREKEKQLHAARAGQEKEWAGSVAGRMSLAKELDRLTAELERLRAILREHGIEPGGDAA